MNSQSSIADRSTPVVSLFSGAGGLDTGFIRAGFRPILAVDFSDAACQTLQHNHPAVTVIKKNLSTVRADFLVERIRELPGREKPVGVIGGPPCQAFSLSNGHKRADDPRARLATHYAKLVSELNSEFGLDFFLFENVPGLNHAKHSNVLGSIKKVFTNAGFWIFGGELDAYDFGVPQVRRRLFIVGFNSRKYPRIDFEFPKPIQGGIRTVRQAIGSLGRPTIFCDFNPQKPPSEHVNHWCMTPRSTKFRNGSLEEGTIQGRPFRVLSWDHPSWTVAYGHREVHVHPSGKRRLSVYEAMRLQGFPPAYELKGTLSDQFRLVSDAVPPPLGYALGRAIADTVASAKAVKPRRFNPEHEVYWTSRYASAHIEPPGIPANFFCKFSRIHFRKLPWRKSSTSPFQVLIAEFLLKQTKAEDVARVWPHLVAKFPTAQALRKARKSHLLKLLRPLGLHNQRATALQRLAQSLVKEFGGKVPGDIESLLTLPGVGLYTATAVCCFKFKKRVPIVDTNVLRVLGRITGKKYGKDLRRADRAWALAWALLPNGECDRHNYGILDFSAKLCNRQPDCFHCPLKRHCVYALNYKGKEFIR
jgi:DNA (cytosine-5)-methyltransferase 1